MEERPNNLWIPKTSPGEMDQRLCSQHSLTRELPTRSRLREAPRTIVRENRMIKDGLSSSRICLGACLPETWGRERCGGVSIFSKSSEAKDKLLDFQLEGS